LDWGKWGERKKGQGNGDREHGLTPRTPTVRGNKKKGPLVRICRSFSNSEEKSRRRTPWCSPRAKVGKEGG